MKLLLSYGAKILSVVSKVLHIGNGSTWPGHSALLLHSTIIEELVTNSHIKIILIAGTNGKTTTATIVTTILKNAGKKVIQNTSGANLLNGITSTLLTSTDFSGNLTADYGVFEVDENNLPLILEHITPKAIICLDLFRDQLDRYGELDSIARNWNASFQKLTDQTMLILNSDDPLISSLAKDVKASVFYFGLGESEKGQKMIEHAADSTYCPNCGHKLSYAKSFYSHLGLWHCPHCGIKRPKPHLSESDYPLPGVYNKYNTLAAVLTSEKMGISKEIIKEALALVRPAFGRQEKIIYQGKQVQIFLSKNPVSMNESLDTITSLGAKYVLFVLNDRIPDGLDISWIWDIDLEKYVEKFEEVTVSGDRVYDMALRLKYAGIGYTSFENLYEAINQAVSSVPSYETLYILPTYSAMLETRKILIGKKIL